MFEEEEYKQIKFFHDNSSYFKSRTDFYIGNNDYKQTKSEKYIDHRWDIPLEISNLKKTIFSKRDFSKKIISFKKFNELLTNSYYINNGKSYHTPSAGNLLSIDCYLFIRNVENIKCGVYFYNKNKNKLNFVRELKEIDFMVDSNQFAKDANCLILLVSRITEVLKKYRSRAYRHVLIESGHIGQNFYTNANKLNMKCCAIGGFYDDKLIDYLSLNDQEFPLYILAIGE